MRPGITLARIALCVSAVSAAPRGGDGHSTQMLQIREETTRNDLEDGDRGHCPDVILIYARGSGEVGNMGDDLGLRLARELENTYLGMWVQGVGGPYRATYLSNVGALGTTQEAVDEGERLFAMAREKCPLSVLVAGGYSQGSALIAAALTQLSGTAIQHNVEGVVLFGYTKNKQNGGEIPEYPKEWTRVYCNKADLLCDGTLILLPSHSDYGEDASKNAPEFLKDRISESHKIDWW